ncbi:EAL domain-containing protein [bacterium]|nr:EAL domain-containing protein [bacterium]
MRRDGRAVSSDVKRLVLVVDDEPVNRELLGFILQDDYEVIYAEDGVEALEKIKANERLSLILLDLLMPRMNGFELLKIIEDDDELKRIPVIVLTSEKKAEVETLNMGASDFITKPYELPEVILARIRRIIELNEDTYIIKNTEHDKLTNLFNREFFINYVGQMDVYHSDQEMDALVCNINNFHLVNEIYGREFGDNLLKRLAELLQEWAIKNDGIVGRAESDTFFIYNRHCDNYDDLQKYVSQNIAKTYASNINVRFGVYQNVDRTIEIEQRFDKAKSVASALRNNFTKFIDYYSEPLHEKELLEQRLISDVNVALEEKQFIVYYQPKYNIKGDEPKLCSAEALIRWKHPELGMISPGVFIPLFEENGLIQKLDRYVWREVAEQIRRWRDEFGIVIPVSVNVSRVDMYDPELVSRFVNLMKDNDLSPHDYILEVTESAYTEDSKQIIGIVENLRKLGFRIEMDDFGSGYSSLNMLSELPIDALKLDMAFVRNLVGHDKKIHLLELIMGIASFLSVPVVAEGVESIDQVDILKDVGCDIIQGYYFSRPVSPEDFAKFIRSEEN